MTLCPDSWMSGLPSHLPLTALSIPGTHNSACHFAALPSVRCQAVPVAAQLAGGVRFLDVRVAARASASPGRGNHSSKADGDDADDLVLVHGAFPVALGGRSTLGEVVLEPVRAFLEERPGECVVLSVKREGMGQASDEVLSEMLMRCYVGRDKGRWWVEDRIPNLGEARGKILLMRRFKGHRGGWGIDAEHWAYNTSHATSGAVCVQDFCELSLKTDMDTKIAYAKAHLECERDPALLYLNFLSASNFWRPLRYWPYSVASKMNPSITEHLREGDLRCSGVVVCDWVGWKGNWDLVHCIIEMNAALLDTDTSS